VIEPAESGRCAFDPRIGEAARAGWLVYRSVVDAVSGQWRACNGGCAAS
jgi:hypothetical protein